MTGTKTALMAAMRARTCAAHQLVRLISSFSVMAQGNVSPPVGNVMEIWIAEILIKVMSMKVLIKKIPLKLLSKNFFCP